jgi:hypothetical protein
MSRSEADAKPKAGMPSSRVPITAATWVGRRRCARGVRDVTGVRRHFTHSSTASPYAARIFGERCPLNEADPQFEWRGADGNPVEPPTNARTYVDIARARVGPFGRIVLAATGAARWKVAVAELQVPRVIANAAGVRALPTDRRPEIIGAFLAEGLPVDPH